MNILKFIESFTDESLLTSKGSRRDSFAQFKTLGAKAAMAAAPLGIGSLLLAPQKADAASSSFLAAAADTPTSALQLALTLEFLEAEFYQRALDANGLIPNADKAIFAQISQHEDDHVMFLRNALAADAPAKPTFDFTAGGNFDPFGDYNTFLALAQAFEDTGVRAYKGQAANLMSKPDLLEYALQIHSVEARHAAQVRRLRNQMGLADQKGWVSGNDRGGLPSQAQPVYDGEENLIQARFNTAAVALRDGAAGAIAGSESFDEPITGTVATAIASLFIVS